MTATKLPRVNFSYLAEMPLDEGLKFISDVSTPLFVHGQRVRRDRDRFRVITHAAASCALKCFSCGGEATHFVIQRHRNDKVMPYSMDLFSGQRLMTWDHIIPRSHGGSDRPENSRIACEACNHDRGNCMTLEELIWVNKQDPRIVYKTVNTAPVPLAKLIIMARAHGEGMDLPAFSNPAATAKTLKFSQAKNSLKNAAKKKKKLEAA